MIFTHLRENNDLEADVETIHEIKTIHLTTINNSNNETDFALIELVRSANICSPEDTKDRKCWSIKPVTLPSPQISIPEKQTVRTLGILLKRVRIS